MRFKSSHFCPLIRRALPGKLNMNSRLYLPKALFQTFQRQSRGELPARLSAAATKPVQQSVFGGTSVQNLLGFLLSALALSELSVSYFTAAYDQ
jgi:hypothetical protein